MRIWSLLVLLAAISIGSSAEAQLDYWALLPTDPVPGELVSLRMGGYPWPTCPIVSHEVTWPTSRTAVVMLHPWPEGCGGGLFPWEREIPLGSLGAGEYTLEVKTYRVAGSTPDNPYLMGTIRFVVGGPPAVPALSTLGLAALAALLVGLGLRRIRP